MVVDFHGWSGDSNSQERYSKFVDVSNEDPDGFFVLTAEGMSDMNHRKKYHSINYQLPKLDYDYRAWLGQLQLQQD